MCACVGVGVGVNQELYSRFADVKQIILVISHCLLCTYYVSCTIVGTEDTAGNKTDKTPPPHRAQSGRQQDE